MKNLLRKCAAFVLAAIMTITMIPMTYANENITVTIGGSQVEFTDQATVTIEGQQVEFTDQVPLIADGRTFVPVRDVFEHLGFTVEWNGDTQQVTLEDDEHIVILTVGSDAFTTNGAIYILHVPAQIINGRTMLPLRAVLESVGYNVGWNNETSTVIISANPLHEPPAPTPSLEAVRLFVFSRGITDERLAEMIESGEIPANITELYLGDNQISDITPLSGLVYLSELYLPGNQISDITPLSGLVNLKYLHLSDNQISDITSLSGLVNLIGLTLDNNQITDITPLSGLVNLTNLSLGDNQINDWSPVAHIRVVIGRP